MAQKQISDLTAASALAAADLLEIETSGGNSRKITAQAIIDLVYPVGIIYTQYATEDSDDPDTAMPAAAAPETLIGGTWEKLYDTEGIDFHTEGFDSTGAQARDGDGVQNDQMQGHRHPVLNEDNEASGNRITENANTGNAGNTPTGAAIGVATDPITDGTNGTPRTGTRTCDKNRWMRIWRRTA